VNTPPTANGLRVVTEQSEVTLPENITPIPLVSPKSQSIPIIPILEEIELIDPQ